MVQDLATNPQSGTGAALRSFQLERDSSKKLSPEVGRGLMAYIETTINAGIGNGYYWPRNNRFRLNRDWSAGKQDMQAMFADRMQMNGKINFLNLKWSCIMIVNRIISGLVGRWMSRNERIVVSAIDPLSVKEKHRQYEDAEFFLHNKDRIAALEQASKIKHSGPNDFIPETQSDLDLWVQDGQHTPEEISYEKAANDILEKGGFFDVMKEHLLYDSAEVGLIGMQVDMDTKGNIILKWVEPENSIYAYSKLPDMKDNSWRGEVDAMKICELVSKYGPGTKRNLSPEQLMDIVATCKDYQLSDKLRWVGEWNVSLMRPYDDWNFDVIKCEIRSLDKDMYVIKETKTNKSTIIKKVNSGIQISENERLQEDEHWNIYYGVYARTAGVLLEWGLKKNMIRPTDPAKSGDCDFSYSFFMYHNINMRNIAVPEKIEEPVQGMVLCTLRIQQLMMRMRPPGAAINMDALEAITLGTAANGTKIKPRQYYDQTGDLYYRGRDAEGNAIPVPITELQNSGFITQYNALVEGYNFHYQRLKDNLGEDPNLITAATKPRVAAENVDTAQNTGDAATDHMYNAYLHIMEDVARKVACLLKPSVLYAGKAYRDLLGEKDVKGRIFDTKIKMLPTDIEVQQFSAYMNQLIASNPDLFSYCDPWKLQRIAKEDVKLAETMFQLAQKKYVLAKQQQAAQNSQQTAQVQIQSAQAKSQSDLGLQKDKYDLELRNRLAESRAQKENTALAGMFAIWAKSGMVPPEAQSLVMELIKSVDIPLMGENMENQLSLSQDIQQLQASQQNQQQGGIPQNQNNLSAPAQAIPPPQSSAPPSAVNNPQSQMA